MAERSLTDQEVREAVRERYAAAATAAQDGCCGDEGCGCGPPGALTSFGADRYDAKARAGVPAAALERSLGCGNPTAVAELRAGEVVLDLGSGTGTDALISARRVGPSGHVYGVDMTEEMLAEARRNAAQAGATNVDWLEGYLEELPLPDASVDVVISNCVINLAADKRRVLREAFRVLRPGGRFAVTDVIADESMADETRASMEAWTGCVAGALTRRDFTAALEAAGFEGIELRETHRVHDAATSAIVRARKPATSR